MAKRYKVIVSYLKFIFDDRDEALDFAETAFDTNVDKGRGVEIHIIKEDEEEDD